MLEKGRLLLPPDEFVDNFDILLYVIHLNRFFGVDDSEGRCRSVVVEITATWLEQTSDDNDFE